MKFCGSFGGFVYVMLKELFIQSWIQIGVQTLKYLQRQFIFFPLILKFGGGDDFFGYVLGAGRNSSISNGWWQWFLHPEYFQKIGWSHFKLGLTILTWFRSTADLISAEWPDLTGSFWPAKILTFWWELPIENWLMLGSSSTSGWNYRMGSFQGLESCWRWCLFWQKIRILFENH